MEKITRTGARLLLIPSTINGTKLWVQESRDCLFLYYGIDPPEFPDHCDGCEAEFSICHALNCKEGGLIKACHNDLRDGVADLASKALTPMYVRDDPKTNLGCTVCGGEGQTQMVPFEGLGGYEWGYPYQRPLDAGDRQYSRDACREYRRHILPVQNPQ